MKTIVTVLAWALIIWGSIGFAANASDLYLSMTHDLKQGVATNSADLSNSRSDIFVVIVFHLFLIVAGFSIKKKFGRKKIDAEETSN